MQTYKLTDYSRIYFQNSDKPDLLEGHSDKEKNFYDNFYEQTENPLKDLRTYQYKLLLKLSGLNRAFGKHLDIGCGDGLFVELSRKMSQSESIGIDAHAPTGREYIFRKSLDEFVAEHAVHTTPDKFDVVSTLDVLEHFQNPASALGNVKRLMKSSSILLLKVPSKDSFLYRSAKIAARILPRLARGTFIRMYQVNYPPPHYKYYNLLSLTKLLKENGFEIEKHGFISETPLKTLKKRLWNIHKAYRPFAYIVLFITQIITPKAMYDGLFVTARLRKS